jgi:hypothetical protein
MSSLIDTVLFVGIAVLSSVLGVLIVRRACDVGKFAEHHEVAGYFMAVVGTLYAVLLGLLVVNIIGKFDQARTMAGAEANACSDIWHLTRGFPPRARVSIRAPLVYYYKLVRNEDWEALHFGKEETSTNAYQHIWRNISQYQPEGNREVACYSALLSTMGQLSDARRFRVLSSQRTVSPIVWAVLITGGVLTVIFTFFFTVTRASTQIVLTSFVALFISLNLLLVKLFDNPYRNEFKIKEQSFNLPPEQLGEMKKLEERTGGVEANPQNEGEEPSDVGQNRANAGQTSTNENAPAQSPPGGESNPNNSATDGATSK